MTCWFDTPRTSDLLRLLRTAALRIAGPLDRIGRSVRGKADLPPLWLRRHTGAVSRFESAAREMASLLDSLGVLGETDAVLDVGCGAGAMTSALARRIGPNGRYVGFDVHSPSIRWCRKRYRKDPRLSFEIAPIASPYGHRSGREATSYRFPMEDAGAGFILAKSVFTHLLEPEARHYLREVRRTLRSGRAAVVTTFLFDARPPGRKAAGIAFPFGDERVRQRSAGRPTAAVAYERIVFERMVRDAGLSVVWMSSGFFPGADRPRGQDILVLGH
jgi:SAM-dependent methyltransferase